MIGAIRGRPVAGWIVGAAFFVVGWAVLYALSPTDEAVAMRERQLARRTPDDFARLRKARLGAAIGGGVVAAWLLVSVIAGLAR